MKKTTLLNAPLSKIVAMMGHTDGLCIADAGLPIPKEMETRIDLALRPGIPSFLDTLDTILTELVVERVLLAKEIKKHNPDILEQILERFKETKIDFVSHEEFKNQTQTVRAVVRSGECLPYSNIILYSGVSF